MGSVEWGFSIEAKGDTPSLVKQVHGNQIHEVRSLTQKGTLIAAAPDGDGVFSKVAGMEIYVFTADCLPVLLYAERSDSPVAALHCGWRGARAGIVAKAAQTYFSNEEKLHAILAPCILSCCFEVKQDFIDEFESAGKSIVPYLETRSGKKYCHLDRYVEFEELKRTGEVLIDRSKLRCTFCSTPELPSYRRNGNTDHRLRTWIRKS